jgi:hypothetical protein
MKFPGMKAHFLVRAEELLEAGLLAQVIRLAGRGLQLPNPGRDVRRAGDRESSGASLLEYLAEVDFTGNVRHQPDFI